MASPAGKLAAIAGLTAIAAWAAGSALPLPYRDGGQRPAAGPALRLSGSAVGLFPGGTTRLRVTVQNRRAFAVVVRRVSVGVRHARRGCRARTVSVRPFRGRLLVRPRARRVVVLRISMARNAPNTCRGARFPLRFRALASRR